MATYPVAAFNFEVKIDGANLSVQEASGFDVTIDTEDIKDGGYNNLVWRVPVRTKFNNLQLKKGIIHGSPSQLMDWFSETIISIGARDQSLTLKDITLILKDQAGSPVLTWTFNNAYPVKWSFGKFNAQENALAFETMEFAYLRYTVS